MAPTGCDSPSVARAKNERPVFPRPAPSLLQFHDDLDLGRRAAGQTIDGDRRPSVFARVAKHREEQFAGAVDHRRAVRKAVHRVHEAVHHHDPGDLIQRTHRRLDIGEGTERAHFGRFFCRLNRLFFAHLADVGLLAVEGRDCTRAKQQISRAHRGHIGPGGDGRIGER